MATRTMVYVGRDRVQIGRWKSSGQVASLVPFPVRDALPIEAVHKAMAEAAALGFERAITSALTPQQAEPFYSAGFTLSEELHLLIRRLDGEITVDRAATRRARKADWDQVLELDSLAFDNFWQFDRNALADAIRATPRHRFQVIKSEPVRGYHVTGLAGANSYVQRVAVHPAAHRRGFGTQLVNDSLRWSWRNGATTSQVNTQVVNDTAVALYERCGFKLATYRLHVLQRDFDDVFEVPPADYA